MRPVTRYRERRAGPIARVHKGNAPIVAAGWPRRCSQVYSPKCLEGANSKAYARCGRGFLTVAVMLADGALKPIIRPRLRVGEGRSTLDGLLIYLQGDRAWCSVGYGFDWD